MDAKDGSAAGTAAREPLKISARDGYRLWARSYDDAPNAVISLVDRHLEIPSGLVIDVACGTGRWVERTGGFGVDMSIEMLARRPGRVAQADARRLPFADGVADITLCILALGYIWPAEDAVAELHRITRPGGLIIAADLHPAAITAGWTRSFRDGGVIYEIENRPYRPDGAVDLYFGEPERALYERAGKAEIAEEVRRIPAVWMKRWRR
jgi:malonyl-CoA O-methyltransferase